MKKIIIAMLIMLFTLNIKSIKGSNTYNYTPLETAIESANSMSVKKVIDNSNFTNSSGDSAEYKFNDLRDVFVYEERIYISDSGNNIIYELDETYSIIGTFPRKDLTEEELEVHKLSSPNGIFVFNGLLYVADTENKRIVVFDIETKNIEMIIDNPDDPTFENLSFKPLKIAVDRTGRIFVIAFDVFEGIMDFNPDGTFSRFYGTNIVTMSFLESLIYRFSSEKQRAKQALKLQTSFTNIDIDNYGYVYTVSRPDVQNTIKKINFKGSDVLNRNGYVNPVGDVVYTNYGDVPTGRSNLVDIAVNPNETSYSVLDEKRGRIFTYDNEGNLLYVFGQLGNQSSMFSRPSALAYYCDNVIVLDRMNKNIVVFEPTNFGKLINQAIQLYLNAEYSEAKALWEEVLVLNSNYFLAYNGIGKAQLREGNFKEAITNLKLGNDRYNYSKAYEQHRNNQLSKTLPYIISITFIGLGFIFYRSVKNSVQREEDEDE